MRFLKVHGTGNDFVLIEPKGVEGDWPALSKRLCHRHFGIGADGLLLVLSSRVADIRMRMFNPDGSEAEMCGNGIRCITKYAVENGLVPASARGLTIETLAGIKSVRPILADGIVSQVQVDMGAPLLGPREIPVDTARLKVEGDPLALSLIKDYPLTLGRHKLNITCVSMGNPHAVCFLEEPVDSFPLAEIGPKVEHHPLFPRRVNFEIVNVLGRGQARVRVWERGAGETMACGTGACAVAVAGRLKGHFQDEVDITLSGGDLKVRWGGKGPVLMTGNAEVVFTGELTDGS